MRFSLSVVDMGPSLVDINMVRRSGASGSTYRPLDQVFPGVSGYINRLFYFTSSAYSSCTPSCAGARLSGGSAWTSVRVHTPTCVLCLLFVAGDNTEGVVSLPRFPYQPFLAASTAIPYSKYLVFYHFGPDIVVSVECTLDPHRILYVRQMTRVSSSPSSSLHRRRHQSPRYGLHIYAATNARRHDRHPHQPKT